MSLLPLVAGPLGEASPSATGAYAAWLDAQVRTVPDAAEADFEAAMAAAVQDAPGSLEAFTRSFARAYERHASGVPLGDLFAAPGLKGDVLFQVLQSRAQHFGRAALPPRLSFGTASPAGPPSRFAGLTPSVVRWTVATVLAPIAVHAPANRAMPCILRCLFSARPMGP